jgi:fused signal recognition particle receptor
VNQALLRALMMLSGFLNNSLGRSLRALLGQQVDVEAFVLTEDNIDALEEQLISADIGIDLSVQVTDVLRLRRQSLHSQDEAINLLKSELSKCLIGLPETLPLWQADVMNVYLIVGVNGVGKTTFIGKWANQLTQQGHRVLIGSGDTFRAAAEDQLAIWTKRANASLVVNAGSRDPAAVMFETVTKAKNEAYPAVIFDTAGRLQNKFNLMEELKKIRITLTKVLPNPVNLQTLLVLDATTGQNALKQAELFNQATQLTGIVLTKWDGSAKGGVVLAVAHQFQLPIVMLGVGEGLNDLIPFDADAFLSGLFQF